MDSKGGGGGRIVSREGAESSQRTNDAEVGEHTVLISPAEEVHARCCSVQVLY
jgi:hypothetical protein